MSQQIVTFLVGDTLLGLSILLIKEVYKYKTLTPIPGAPEHLAGLMNLRGKVVTVIDLNVSLNLRRIKDNEENKLLILKTDSEILQSQNNGEMLNVKIGEDIVGLFIDKMKDVLDIEDEDILPTPPNLDTVEKELIEGVLKLKDRLVILLNVNDLLEKVINIINDAEKLKLEK